MATYISKQTGNWTSASTWLTAAAGTFTPTASAGAAPQSGGGDKIVIRSPHVVTYNTSGTFGDGGNGLVGGTITVTSGSIILSGGTLRASRTENTALTAFGTIFVAGNSTATGSFLDWGTLNDPVSAVTSTISMSALSAGMAGVYVQGGVGTVTVTNSACFCGLEKTRNTFLSLPAAAGQRVIAVDSCRNWANNDFILIESDTTSTSRTLSARISNISGNTITLDTDVNFARLSGTRVGNFTSTVTYKTAERSPAAYGFLINGTTNGIYQFSYMTCENLWDVLRRSDTGVAVSTLFGCIYYRSAFNLTQATLRGIAIQQLLTNTGPMNGIVVDGVPYDEVVIDDIAFNSQSTNTVGRGICFFNTNSVVRLKNSVCYKSYYGYLNTSVYKATLENCYLNSEFYINIGNTGTYNTLNNCRIRTNTPFSNWDNLVNLQLNNCNITSLSSRAIVTNTSNSFGDITLNNCTLNNIPLSSYTLDVATTRTLIDANYNIFNPNNNNTYTTFNYFHHATTNSSIRKNGLTSLSFRPKVPNTAFVKTFTAPAIEGVTQKIKGNLRFDTNYGTATPPSITFGGAVANTTFTCPAVANTWHSFEYDLTPIITGDIEIKISGQSTNTNGFVYVDGLILDPFIKDVRWYGFEVDKNLYRTVDNNTTLTENQVSAYPYINNLDFVYDESKYWTVTNPALSSYIDLVDNVGKTLDFSNKSILLNSSALSSVSYNPTTNIVTLSTFSLSAGNIFNAIQTTGGITINDNSAISNVSFIGSVSATSAKNLNGVIIDGTLTYNTNSTSVITYTNSNIKKVENNGSGIITLNRSNTVVTEAGRNIVLLDNPTYINISNLNGGYVAIFDNTTTLRYYTNTEGQIILPNGSTGTWSYKVGRYQSKVISGTFSVGGTVNISPAYSQDLNVDTTVTVASAYTSFRNTQQVYDYFSYYMTTSSGLSYPEFYNYRPILDITNKDLIINPSSPIPFSYDGTRFTIKSENLQNGSIVKGVETTGNIYLSGSASLSAINIISNTINSETLFDLKSVNAASNIVYNTNTPSSSIVYTNCIVDKVENIGSGDIFIKKLNSTITDGTDAQILDYYPTFLNLSLNAGTIAIYNDSGNRQYFTSTNQIIELPYEADGPWTYRVTRYGQRTVEGNFTVNRVIGNTFDITPTFQPDINILGTLNSVSAYSTFTSIQSIYDYMSYYKTTTTGINFGDLTNVGSILDIGSRSLILDRTSPSLFNVTSNSISLSTNSLSAGGGSIVNSLKTTNKVFLSGGSTLRSINLQGSMNQETVSDLYGMTVDGAIRYKVDVPTSITYTNCNVNTVVNDGNELVTITRINSIITNATDPEISTVVPISINITVDSDTYVVVYKPNGDRYYYGSGNTTLILGGNAVTGNWSYKVVKYAHLMYTANFPIDKDISSVTNINPTLIVDASITEANVNTVISYTDLNTTRKIYDYLSYYKTTTDGIDYGDIATRSIGAIFFNKALTLDTTATLKVDIVSNVLTLKSSGLNEEITVYSTGDFLLLNSSTISDFVKIRATNIDSELNLVGITELILYPSSTDSNADTNRGPVITSTVYRFKYGSTVSGVTLEGTQYSRVDIGNILLYIFVLTSGSNILDLGTFGQIQQVLSNQIVINDGVKKASRLIPHSTDL